MSDYDPVKCLQEEVARWATNQSASMPVTGFYIQAAAVLAEHKKQKERIAELERENAELQQEHDFLMKWFEKHGTKEHHSVFEVFDNVEVERNQLRLQVVRLREALEGMSELCGNYFDEKGLVCARDKEIWALHLKALSETPAQSAKEVLGRALELLKEIEPRLHIYSDPLPMLVTEEIARLKRLCE